MDAFSKLGKNILRVLDNTSYLIQREKNNKKQFRLETEGAMVTRQLQTWINCIMSSMVTLFPAAAPQLVSSNQPLPVLLSLFSSL